MYVCEGGAVYILCENTVVVMLGMGGGEVYSSKGSAVPVGERRRGVGGVECME